MLSIYLLPSRGEIERGARALVSPVSMRLAREWRELCTLHASGCESSWSEWRADREVCPRFFSTRPVHRHKCAPYATLSWHSDAVVSSRSRKESGCVVAWRETHEGLRSYASRIDASIALVWPV